MFFIVESPEFCTNSTSDLQTEQVCMADFREKCEVADSVSSCRKYKQMPNEVLGMQMSYNTGWNYSCEQSYAYAEMAKNGKLICQAFTFTAVLSTYVCNSVISTVKRVYGRKGHHLVHWEKDNSQK